MASACGADNLLSEPSRMNNRRLSGAVTVSCCVVCASRYAIELTCLCAAIVLYHSCMYSLTSSYFVEFLNVSYYDYVASYVVSTEWMATFVRASLLQKLASGMAALQLGTYVIVHYKVVVF